MIPLPQPLSSQALSSQAPSPLEQRASGSDLRWLYVDLNSYFASVEQEKQPHLRDKPVAVVAVETDWTCAIAASYEAKAYGVRTGTRIHEAKQMCPGLICVPARHELYVEYHHRVLEEVDRHIPVTAICSIDEVACRLMRNEAPEDAARHIAQAIKRGLRDNVGEYIRCSIGIAPNRYLAKIATDLQKPDGLVVLHHADLPGRLLNLTLRDLPGVGANVEKRLAMAGIKDFPALWALDAERMRTIWGSVWGERVWHLLRGADLAEEETQRHSISHSHVMAPELRDPVKARYVARRLTLKAASRLRRMEYYASALHFSASLENGSHLQGGERCWRAKDSTTFLHILDRIWDGTVGKAKNVRVKKVAVSLHGLVAATDLQGDLFDTPSLRERETRAKAEKISGALDKLNHRFGRDMVLVGMLPSEGKTFSGSKIAFTRIPDREEFLE
jgi:DNA polymerase-4